MSTWTRSVKAEAYEHVFKNVLEVEDDDPIANIFTGAERDVDSIAGINMDDFAQLEYHAKDDNGNNVMYPLPLLYYRKLQRFKCWMVWLKHNKEYPGRDLDAWKELTPDDFVDFGASPQCVAMMEDRSLFASYTSASVTAATTKPKFTPAEAFKKGIKRDKTQFPVLKRDMDWNEFKGSTITEANAQGVETVFDHAYVPITSDDIALFKEKQKFVLSVFERSLQTQNGKSIVRKHREDGDAQKTWKEVCDVYEQSIHASVNAADLLEYITTARLGDGKWKSGCENFIIHWDKTCDDYDNLCDDPTDRIGQGQRKTMLQNAVSLIDDLLKRIRTR